MRDRTALLVSPGSPGGLVFGCKLGFTDGKLLGFRVGYAYGIKLGLDKLNELGSAV